METYEPLTCPACGSENLFYRVVQYETHRVRGIDKNGKISLGARRDVLEVEYADFICSACDHQWSAEDNIIMH